MSDIQKYTFSLLFTIILFYLIWSIKFILIYIFISSILALFGKPIVEKLNQIKISRFYFPPAISAILTMLALLVIILSLFSTLIPILAAEIHAISEIDIHAVVKKLREPLAKLYNWLSNYGLSESLSSIEEKIISLLSIGNISTVVNNLVSLFGNISIAIFSILFITFFLLKDTELTKNIFKTFVPENQKEKVSNVLNNTKILLRRYFIGLVIQIALISTFITSSLAVLGIENAIAIGFFAGIINIIPYLGPLIGLGAGISITLLSNIELAFPELLSLCLILILVFGVVQIIDNLILQPYIFSNSVKAHPLEIFLVIITSGTLVGIGGMILAVPTYTFIRIILKEFLFEYQLVQNLTKNL